MNLTIWHYTTLRMIAIVFVLAGALNWGAVLLGYNVVERINIVIGHLFHKRFSLDRVIYFLVAISAVFLAIDRTLWLPFLGETVLPEVLIPVKDHVGKEKVTVKVYPNTKVAYWAALPKSADKDDDKDPSVEVAYDGYTNSGVVMSDADGNAVLTFDKGSSYIVPSGKTIQSHVHYRELRGKYGVIGPVQSVFV